MEVLELDKNVLNIEKGRIGEQLIEDNINKHIDIYHKTIKNVILNKEDKKTEIDIILITCTGIFVIESKNFNGYIYGNNKHRKWTQVLTKDKHNIFDNPIIQNQYHIDFISNNLKLDQSYFHSYVVFGDNSKLQNIIIDNTETNNIRVINNSNLIENLLLDIHRDDIKLSHEQIDKMYVDLKYFYEHLAPNIK